MLVFTVNGAYAADGDLFLTEDSSGNDIRINTTGQAIGWRADYEVATTNDTLTAAESGKTIVANPTSYTTFTLPTAATGLRYRFLVANGNSGTTAGMIALSPQSTDTFEGCVASNATTSFTTGDDLVSPGATGDSVEIIGASTKWYCVNRIGTWTDGN